MLRHHARCQHYWTSSRHNSNSGSNLVRRHLGLIRSVESVDVVSIHKCCDVTTKLSMHIIKLTSDLYSAELCVDRIRAHKVTTHRVKKHNAVNPLISGRISLPKKLVVPRPPRRTFHACHKHVSITCVIYRDGLWSRGQGALALRFTCCPPQIQKAS